MWGITSKITRLTFDPLFGTVGLRREFFESSPSILVSDARHRRRRDGWGPGNDTRGALAIERGLTWSFFEPQIMQTKSAWEKQASLPPLLESSRRLWGGR